MILKRNFQHAFRVGLISFFSTVFILLSGCDKAEDNRFSPQFSDRPQLSQTEYVIGVHPLHNSQRLFEVFGPLTRYLSDNIPAVSFKLEASRNYAAYEKKLYARAFPFSLPNPYQTINAIDRGYQVFAKMGDDQNFRGIILTRKDSGIKSVTDLKGGAVSYPAPTALAATMMPQYFIQSHGVDVVSELDNRYVGSPESAVMSVFLGQTVAASTWPPPWYALKKERPELAEQLTISWETKPLLNNGFVVLPTVPDHIVEQVKAVLINLHKSEEGQKILTSMELSRFEEASNSTYIPIRKFIQDFSREVRLIEGP